MGCSGSKAEASMLKVDEYVQQLKSDSQALQKQGSANLLALAEEEGKVLINNKDVLKALLNASQNGYTDKIKTNSLVALGLIASYNEMDLTSLIQQI
jgi:hypothetical protein